jgi:hypothetical protein
LGRRFVGIGRLRAASAPASATSSADLKLVETHRYVMHKRIDVFALRAIYERHTR